MLGQILFNNCHALNLRFLFCSGMCTAGPGYMFCVAFPIARRVPVVICIIKSTYKQGDSVWLGRFESFFWQRHRSVFGVVLLQECRKVTFMVG
jgi:hypothetical protein